MEKNQHNKCITNGRTAISPSHGVVNTQHVKITQSAKYILTVGFEVNNPEAFENDVHHVNIDYGHAFFYITKDNIVTVFFSFGPDRYRDDSNESDKIRPGDTSYGITESSKLYRLIITEKQAIDVKKLVDEFTKDVERGRKQFNIYFNDTCAKVARHILQRAKIYTPKGSSSVHTDSDVLTEMVIGILQYVNPYKWESEFAKTYSNPIHLPAKYFTNTYSANPDLADATGVISGVLKAGDKDPLYRYGGEVIRNSEERIYVGRFPGAGDY